MEPFASALRAAALVVVMAHVAAVPARPRAPQGIEAFPRPAADPPPGPACNMTSPEECDSVPCCTWCGSQWNAGWCSKVASWAKNCSKSVKMCDSAPNKTSCCSSNMCMWTEKNSKAPPNCTIDPPPAPPGPTPAPPSPGPAPKFSCEMMSAEECDASGCCNWCTSTWNTSASWCMPILNKQIPMASCSKDAGPCETKAQSACAASDTCIWIEVHDGRDPQGEGVCVTDWEKCWAPSIVHQPAARARTHQHTRTRALSRTSESRASQPLRSHLEHLKRHLPQEYRRLMQAYYMGAPREGTSNGLRRETESDAPMPSQSSALDADPKPSGTCSSVCKN